MLVPRVAVVQPREALAQTLARHLAGAGFEPEILVDGDAAVRVAVTESVWAVVVDLTLPALDGWCVLATLGTRSGPLLVTYGAPGDAERAMLLGATACVHDRGAVVAALQRLRARVLT